MKFSFKLSLAAFLFLMGISMQPLFPRNTAAPLLTDTGALPHFFSMALAEDSRDSDRHDGDYRRDNDADDHRSEGDRRSDSDDEHANSTNSTGDGDDDDRHDGDRRDDDDDREHRSGGNTVTSQGAAKSKSKSKVYQY